jgi:hypothetical protein
VDFFYDIRFETCENHPIHAQHLVICFTFVKTNLKTHMKKLLLTIAVVGSALLSQAQVICSVESPANIAGNYDFTWADPAGGWGTPDFLIPGTFITGELIMVNDGTPGTNATYGNNLSEEGCNPSLPNAYAGKICVIRRNTCEFGLKALEAQNAGAIGVIVVNRDPEVIAMGSGASGASVTIPCVMITSTDGATIIDEMANGPVTAFIGNKAGLYANDGGISAGTSLISKYSGVNSLLAQDNTEFSFAIGTEVVNWGSAAQSNVTVNAKVTDPSGATVYNNTVTITSPMQSGDTVDIFPGGAYSFPDFSLPTYADGRYTVSYTLSLSGADDYDADNAVSSDFTVTDSILSYALLDETTNHPVSNNGYRPSTNNQTFSTCMMISDPNASRIGVNGVYFSASTAATSGVALTGEEIALYLYRWDDPFVDLNDAALAFTALTSVGSGFYYFPGDLQGETVYGAFDSPVVLEDGARYLACAQTVNLDIYLGHDTKTNYTWNEAYYLQPISPNESDAAWFASGFGADAISAMAVNVFDVNSIGIEENTLEGVAYPNPATDVVTVSMKAEGTATLTVTDVAGKVAFSNAINLVNGKSQINIAALEAGVYVFNVVLEDGKTSQFNVVKR